MEPDLTAIAARWSLRLGREYHGGQTSTMVRAQSPVHGDVVLKVIRRHHEAEHEADGLRVWDGEGAVRLHEHEVLDDDHAALLLERCEPGTSLQTRPEEEQDDVVAELLRRLWRPAGAPFRPLAEMCAMWAEAAERREHHPDPAIHRDGLDLFRSLSVPGDGDVLLCTDLHAGNVVASQREPWLMIDPKPYVGDPHYDALQHMLNCPDRLRAAPLELVNRMADLLDLDRVRLRLWLFARCVQQSDYPLLRDVATAVAP